MNVLYVIVHLQSVIFAHLTEMVFLISVYSLDIAMSNSTSGGFISISVIKLWHLEIDYFESMNQENEQIPFPCMIPYK